MSETLRKYGAKYNTTFCSLCGLSTDTKPMGDFDGVGIANGSEFIEMDTGKKFKYDAESSVWNEVSSGGGGSTTLIEKSITANGEYNASDDSADGYSKVTVDVANSYTQADEGKVVSNGTLVAQTTHAEITENGTYDITTNNSVSVNVSGGDDNFGITAKCKPVTKQLKSKAFTTKTWTGLSDFYGEYIWTDGENIYYSSSSSQYVLDKENSSWTAKTWTNLTNLNGRYIWTDGKDIYYSNSSSQYVLDKTTSTWSTRTWAGLTNFSGEYIWTDGDNIYYSGATSQYVLLPNTNRFVLSSIMGASSTSYAYGNGVWTDGENIYLSQYQTSLILETTEYKNLNSLPSCKPTYITT